MAKIMVIYHSDTGNTKRLAEMIGAGASSGGANVTVVPAADLDLDAAAAADAIAVGSPDYFSYCAGTVKTFFDRAYVSGKFKGKPCVAFGTHGGGARVLDVLERLCEAIGMKVASPGLLLKGDFGAEAAPKAQDLGRKLAQAVKA